VTDKRAVFRSFTLSGITQAAHHTPKAVIGFFSDEINRMLHLCKEDAMQGIVGAQLCVHQPYAFRIEGYPHMVDGAYVPSTDTVHIAYPCDKREQAPILGRQSTEASTIGTFRHELAHRLIMREARVCHNWLEFIRIHSPDFSVVSEMCTQEEGTLGSHAFCEMFAMWFNPLFNARNLDFEIVCWFAHNFPLR